jgi:hypothetical protein
MKREIHEESPVLKASGQGDYTALETNITALRR